MILKDQYQTGVEGLGGNDDFGLISAWYIFSSFGFYPVAPRFIEYAMGSPAINRAEINLSNGIRFTVIAKNQSAGDIFIKKLELNVQWQEEPFIIHNDMIDVGELKFYISSEPNKEIKKNK